MDLLTVPKTVVIAVPVFRIRILKQLLSIRQTIIITVHYAPIITSEPGVQAVVDLASVPGITVVRVLFLWIGTMDQAFLAVH